MSIITLQFGQCGNQIGQKLYEFVYDDIKESKSNLYGIESKNLWFRINRKNEWLPRSILIDTENKVTAFANTQKNYHFQNVISKAQGGSANNWAFGYNCMSETLINDVFECIRKEVEQSDYIISFLNVLSAAGGTGSGVGSKLIKRLTEEYSSKIIVNALILPFNNGEVVTQNYNTVLTLAKLQKYSDATILFENDKLHKIGSGLVARDSQVDFKDMNEIIVQQLAGLCQPVRNFNLPTLVSNLAPHPSYKFLQIRAAPYVHKESVLYETGCTWQSLIKTIYRGINMDARELKSNNKFKCLGKVFVSRGKDLLNTNDLKSNINSKTFANWIPSDLHYNCYHSFEQLKSKEKYLMAVMNSNLITGSLDNIIQDAWDLFTSGAYIHHYKKYDIDESYFLKSFERLESLLHDYENL